MTQKEFDKILEARVAAMRQTLAGKGAEYGGGGDRLHNFKVAAQLESTPQTPEQALWGMLKKHLVSVIDIIAATGLGGCPSPALRGEKLGDAINYLVLLEALLIERSGDYEVRRDDRRPTVTDPVWPQSLEDELHKRISGGSFDGKPATQRKTAPTWRTTP